MTSKGEAVAIGISMTSSPVIKSLLHGEVAKVKRV